MSALDLFASALGAFILIAIVIFPYFPNTSRVVAPPPPLPDARQAQGDIRTLEVVQERLAEVESELATSRTRLAGVTVDARALADAQARLADLRGRLVDADTRERRLEAALQDEQRRKFLLITISWDRDDDVDLHIVDPRGNEYYYLARHHAGSPAQFEEDTTDGPGNEMWLHPRVEPGEYAVYYNLYSRRSNAVTVRGSAVHSDGREELPRAQLSREGMRRLVATVVVTQEGRVSVR